MPFILMNPKQPKDTLGIFENYNDYIVAAIIVDYEYSELDNPFLKYMAPQLKTILMKQQEARTLLTTINKKEARKESYKDGENLKKEIDQHKADLKKIESDLASLSKKLLAKIHPDKIKLTHKTAEYINKDIEDYTGYLLVNLVKNDAAFKDKNSEEIKESIFESIRHTCSKKIPLTNAENVEYISKATSKISIHAEKIETANQMRDGHIKETEHFEAGGNALNAFLTKIAPKAQVATLMNERQHVFFNIFPKPRNNMQQAPTSTHQNADQKKATYMQEAQNVEQKNKKDFLDPFIAGLNEIIIALHKAWQEGDKSYFETLKNNENVKILSSEFEHFKEYEKQEGKEVSFHNYEWLEVALDAIKPEATAENKELKIPDRKVIKQTTNNTLFQSELPFYFVMKRLQPNSDEVSQRIAEILARHSDKIKDMNRIIISKTRQKPLAPISNNTTKQTAPERETTEFQRIAAEMQVRREQQGQEKIGPNKNKPT